MSDDTYRDALAVGTEIGGYVITKVLGQGGFGITYAASSAAGLVARTVAIKEFFPHGLAYRESGTIVLSSRIDRVAYDSALKRFEIEARKLVDEYDHPNIVRGENVLHAHGSVFLVMEYVDGVTLFDWVKQRPALSESELRQLMIPILDAVDYLHAHHAIHRDLSPRNLMIRTSKRGLATVEPVLIDFGAVGIGLDLVHDSTIAVANPVYSPPEQQEPSGVMQGRYTDVFALGGCVYFAACGTMPTKPMTRLAAVASGAVDPLRGVDDVVDDSSVYSLRFFDGVRSALQLDAKARPQSVTDLRMRLGWAGVDAPTVIVRPTAQPTADTRGGNRQRGLLLAGAVCVVALGGTGALIWSKGLTVGREIPAHVPAKLAQTPEKSTVLALNTPSDHAVAAANPVQPIEPLPAASPVKLVEPPPVASTPKAVEQAPVAVIAKPVEPSPVASTLPPKPAEPLPAAKPIPQESSAHDEPPDIDKEQASLPPTSASPPQTSLATPAGKEPLPTPEPANLTVVQMSQRYASLDRSAGPIAQPKSAPEVYYNARLAESLGNQLVARKAYLDLARMDVDAVDAWINFATVLRVQDGRAGTREVFAGLAPSPKSAAYELVESTLYDDVERKRRIEAFVATHPTYGPGWYLLADELSEARLGSQTLDEKHRESDALAKFLGADDEGDLVRHFLDPVVLGSWVDKARRRKTAIDFTLDAAHTTPAATFMRSNSDWSVSVQLPEPAIGFAYRFGTEGDFTTAGQGQAIDARTGKPFPNTLISVVPGREPKVIDVRYTDLRGHDVGPFSLPFDPQAALLRQTRDTLEMTKGSWVAFGGYNSPLMYVTQLVSFRCGIEKATYGLDGAAPEKPLSLPACNPRDPYAIPADFTPYLKIPSSTKSATVLLTFKDGSTSTTTIPRQ